MTSSLIATSCWYHSLSNGDATTDHLSESWGFLVLRGVILLVCSIKCEFALLLGKHIIQLQFTPAQNWYCDGCPRWSIWLAGLSYWRKYGSHFGSCSNALDFCWIHFAYGLWLQSGVDKIAMCLFSHSSTTDYIQGKVIMPKGHFQKDFVMENSH